MKFSPFTKGFYDPIINKNIPKGAIDVSHEKYRELLDGESTGESEIVSDPISGMPGLVKKAFDLESYKNQSINRLYDISEKFIRKYFHSWTIETAIWILVSKDPSSQSAKSILDWVWTVRNNVILKQDAIEMATDKASIDAEVIDKDYLESKYGKNGETFTAPTIKLNQLSTA